MYQVCVILIDIDKMNKNVIYSDNKKVFNFLLNGPVSRIARIVVANGFGDDMALAKSATLFYQFNTFRKLAR